MNRFPAPAKLNLFLHVTGRRSDGYHLLQTAFQLIDRCDELGIAVRQDGAINRLNHLPELPAEQDLIVRAARLLQQKTACDLGADLYLEKLLPMGGGLGGGSSDAATTLIALNHLWRTDLNRQQLMHLGLQLGADVPFFIYGQTAFAEGVGEELQALHAPERWVVVIEPGVQVPTPRIFSAPDLTRDTKPIRIADFSSHAEIHWKNDLQAPACRMFPEVENAILWLKQFGNAKMSGSGACVFCMLSSLAEAESVIEKSTGYWKAWLAKTLPQHPLKDLLQD